MESDKVTNLFKAMLVVKEILRIVQLTNQIAILVTGQYQYSIAKINSYHDTVSQCIDELKDISPVFAKEIESCES